MRFLVFIAIFLAGDAGAIVWRADIDSVQTEQKKVMKNAGKVFYSPLKIFGGSCVAIGGDWVLTARHCVDKWKNKQLAVGFPALGDAVYQIAEVHLHPQADLALLKLKAPVLNTEKIQFSQAINEVGKRVWIGGFGLAGQVDKPSKVGEFHAGYNRVDRLRRGKLSISLSRPGEKDAEDQEAVLAVFDSGSPLFLQKKTGWKLAGIASTASNGMKPKYGGSGNYVRLSQFLEWIKEIRSK